MTPGARMQATIELLEESEAAPLTPLHTLASRFLRARRYIGAKDRRTILDTAFRLVRRKARLIWWLERAGHPEAGPRAWLIADLVLGRGRDEEVLAALFTGKGYAAAPLSPPEEAVVASLDGHGLNDAEQPLAVRLEVPEWLLPRLEEAFGARLEEELAAFQREAGLDLRVNTLKGAREDAIESLKADGISAAPTPLSPVGLRLGGRTGVNHARAYGEGLVELQDEGSQLAALLAGVRPGHRVLDFCAGAGGKTLALAAELKGEGRLVACDIDGGRLWKARERLARAGAEFVELARWGHGAEDLLDEATFDRVLIDAPCSGTGTWRRHPDARWRFHESMLEQSLETQARLMDKAVRYLRPGGRLVYVTCSVLPCENERQASAFLDRTPDLSQVPAAEVWQEQLPGCPPASGNAIFLTPARHGTDAFFVAVFERGE